MIRTLLFTFTQAENIGTKLHVKVTVYDRINHVVDDVESLQDEENDHLSSWNIVPEFRRKFAYDKKNARRRIGDQITQNNGEEHHVKVNFALFECPRPGEVFGAALTGFVVWQGVELEWGEVDTLPLASFPELVVAVDDDSDRNVEETHSQNVNYHEDKDDVVVDRLVRRVVPCPRETRQPCDVLPLKYPLYPHVPRKHQNRSWIQDRKSHN